MSILPTERNAEFGVFRGAHKKNELSPNTGYLSTFPEGKTPRTFAAGFLEPKTRITNHSIINSMKNVISFLGAPQSSKVKACNRGRRSFYSSGSWYILLFVLFLFAGTYRVSAQDASKDYFAGKWEVLVKGSPEGDATALVELKRIDGTLQGTIAIGNDKTASKITSVEEKANNVTVYFSSSMGYDVYLYMEKVDENQVTGTVMDMFDLTGKRMADSR
jgi:hypothetical protein